MHCERVSVRSLLAIGITECIFAGFTDEVEKEIILLFLKFLVREERVLISHVTPR
jgi:hypothetical protein